MEKIKTNTHQTSNRLKAIFDENDTSNWFLRRHQLGNFQDIPEKTTVDNSQYKLLKYTHKDDLTGIMDEDEWPEKYLRRTADLISMLDGSNYLNVKPDAAIFLDKSARPVAAFANLFWDDFAVKGAQKPSQSFLNIDRVRIFNFAEEIVDADGRFVASHYKAGQLAQPHDFLEYINSKQNDKVFQEQLDRLRIAIRSQYVDSENINSSDIYKILDMPTSLDGKNVLIVDEVERTGSTLFMAETLLKMAIPEIGDINSTTFWGATSAETGHVFNADGTVRERRMGGVPIWYDPTEVFGRGIGGHSQFYFDKAHEKANSSISLKHKIGSAVLSAPHFRYTHDEQGYKFVGDNKFIDLMIDVKQLRNDYRSGKIKFIGSANWTDERYEEFLQLKNAR